MTVRRLWVMLVGSLIARDTETPKRDAHRSISSRSPVTKVHSRGSAPRSCACFLSTGGGSSSGGKPHPSRGRLRLVVLSLQLLLDFRELLVHQRAEGRHRALGVDECDDHRVALEGVELDVLAV